MVDLWQVVQKLYAEKKWILHWSIYRVFMVYAFENFTLFFLFQISRIQYFKNYPQNNQCSTGDSMLILNIYFIFILLEIYFEKSFEKKSKLALVYHLG